MGVNFDRCAIQRGTQRSRALIILGSTTLLLLSGCHRTSPADQHVGEANNASAQTVETAADVSAKPDLGPALLSTVGLFETATITAIKAKQGRFEIRQAAQNKQLFVNGIPWNYYSSTPGVAPSPIEANVDITLVGVIELPRESVAWILITGGTACPGTHVLVSIRDGKPLIGQEIPGCDDRGTIRRVDDDHLVFEAGGSTGTYRAGELKVETSANAGAQ